ncbi:DUF4422 domain-containing protein [Paraburkholderia silviterrae]|uniref:DUF4422 domain-containing protein n=1 Tax=Paraburkholderia silviterrae TaxID=2528715 RepID=A0A4V2ZXW5_9BURK|nr:DUF4422 domain-containing protein [Paraburkholderia silviterrae]TDG17405.1 DUF4422 domain-containing protein [Paraburkholderia silviterrae]
MSTMTSSAHIYVCYHKPIPVTVSDACFLPIQVGAARSSAKLGLIRDDTGENISLKNGTFCELTALYWAWKNDHDARWIGLMHYRRFLDFSGETHEIDVHGCANYDKLDYATIEKLGLTTSHVESLLNSKAGLLAVLPQKWSVRNAGNRTLRAHYVKAAHHHEADLDVLREVIDELYPADVEHFDAVMAAHDGYFTNIFVLRRDLFDEYCEWLFSILFEVERRLDLTNYSVAAQRVFGYMSERLFNIFAHKRLADPAKYVELERVFVRDERVIYHAPERPPAHAVSVVTASDGNFVPHLATFMTSVQASLDPQRELDLVVLDGGIPADQRSMLERQFRLNGRGRLTFVSCSHMFGDIPLHAHFSAATFYRLSLGELLANHDRVVYVDADTVVLGDLSTLFDMELDGNAVAAVPDIIMRSFAATGVPALKEAGGARAGNYLRDWLGMGDRGHEYFQAGLIVMDLEALRKMNLREVAYADLTSKRYWFLDQDVLNKHLVGHVKFLDLSWNVVNMSMDVVSGLHVNLAEKVREAFASPRMIHYAGFEAKPWNNAAAPLAYFYWYFLRRTFWYEAVIERRPVAAKTVDASMNRSRAYRLARKVWRRMPNRLQRTLFWARDMML